MSNLGSSGSPASLVERSLKDGVAVLHMNDPAHRNVLSQQMSDEIAAGVAASLADGAGAIVLTAAAPVFCSGGSLDALLNRTNPLRQIYVGFNALADAPVPTIAAVGGAAVGAGVNLPLACDVVIASPSARFDPRFLDVGIHPGGAHLLRLIRRVGAQGAAALSLCGDALTGEEAAVAGLAWRCVPDDELESTALKLARRAAQRDHELVRRTKATLRASEKLLDAAEAFELELVSQQWSTDRPGFDDQVRRVQEALAQRKPK
jgi:enoyl-CoA hydratase